MSFTRVRFLTRRLLATLESKYHVQHPNCKAIRKYQRTSSKPLLILSSCFCTSSDKKDFYLTTPKDAVKNEFQTYIEQNKERLRVTEQKFILKRDVILDDIRHRKERMKEGIKQKRDKMKEEIKYKTECIKEKVGEIIEKENIYTIPNLLCVSRIALSPYLGMLIVQADFHFALAILGVAAITDLLDGWIARNWESQSSKVGSFLDPVADKVLIATLFLTLTYANLIPVALTGLIVIRDVLLLIAGSIIRYKSLPPPKTLGRYFDVTHATAQLSPTFAGKVNTALQLILVGSTLAAPIFQYVDHPLLHTLWYVTGASTIAAGMSYVISKNTYRFLKRKNS